MIAKDFTDFVASLQVIDWATLLIMAVVFVLMWQCLGDEGVYRDKPDA